MIEDKSEWTKQRWISWADEAGLGLTAAQKRMTKFDLIREIEAMHRAAEGLARFSEGTSPNNAETDEISTEIHRKNKRYSR